jgi:hypothetical protein
MFLSCNLLIALINMPCKSSHCIVRLKPCIGVCHPDSHDYTSEQEHRTARTRGGRGQDNEKRMAWEQRCRGCRGVEGVEVSRVQRYRGCRGVEGAEDRGDLWGETCSARRSRVVEGERCQEGLLSTERWVSN